MSLTDEDKQWINAQLERVETALNTGIERVETALNARIEYVETALNARIGHVETALNARIEHVETALLTEFHKWASPIEMRVRTHSAVLRAMDLEVEAVVERVTKLESRDNPMRPGV